MILVTGASGQLASQTLAALHARGVPAEGGSRRPGPGVRHLDLDEPAGLDLRRVSVLVLVSAGYAEDDRVVARHAAAIEAAVRDGVGHVVYTSVTAAGDHLGFALAHRVTERLLEGSGVAFTVLRNGLYAELFGVLLTWTPAGLESAFGTGALSAVARQDLAEAAAVVAAAPTEHRGATYELVGAPITADDVARRLGVAHRTVGLAQYRDELLASDGLLPFQPPMLTSIATSVRHGFLSASGPDLTALLGRPALDPLVLAAATAEASRPRSDAAPVAQPADQRAG